MNRRTTTSVSMVVFHMKVGQPVPHFLSPLVLEKNSWDKSNRFLTGQMSFLTPNQQSQRIEGNSKHLNGEKQKWRKSPTGLILLSYKLAALTSLLQCQYISHSRLVDKNLFTEIHLMFIRSSPSRYFLYLEKCTGPNFSFSTTTTTTTILRPFSRDHPDEPVPEENFWTLWCKGRSTEADTPTIRLGATPSGLSSAHLSHPHFYRPDALPATQPTVSKH